MKSKLHTHTMNAEIVCPFCGQTDDLCVDPGGGDYQKYTEDCAVCSRPRIVHIRPDETGEELRVWAERAE